MMRRICGLTILALLVSLCLSSAAMAANSVGLSLKRSDNSTFPFAAPFLAGFNVDLSSVTGVTGVTVWIGSSPYPLTLQDVGQWASFAVFFDLTAMKTTLNGLWTIDIAGSSPSTSTFTLTTTGLADGDFFATATGLSPVDGATGVSADTLISWADPTGSSTPYALSVFVGSPWARGGIQQNALSLDPGGIPVTATNWQPPSPLPAGDNLLAVIYFDVDAALASSLA